MLEIGLVRFRLPILYHNVLMLWAPHIASLHQSNTTFCNIFQHFIINAEHISFIINEHLFGTNLTKLCVYVFNLVCSLTSDTGCTEYRGGNIHTSISLNIVIHREYCIPYSILTSILYLSLACCLSSMAGMQGMMQPSSM